MIKKLSPEEQISTMQRLIKFGVNENKTTDLTPNVEFKKKAANGKTYGIVHEGTKFYIMEAPQKDTEVLAEDFDYIGGFNNRKENAYSSYAKAYNALDLKIMSINETVSKENRVLIEQPKLQSAEWETPITEGMRREIDRFKTITTNVETILSEKKERDIIPSEHTLPEAPATNPSDEKVNTPFTDTAVAKGDKDFKEEEHNHETAGKPFVKDGKVSNKEMQSDKKPVVKVDAVYTEKAKFVPDNTVADKNPSGGEVVRVNEGKKKIRLKLTEEQVLAVNNNKEYMDTSKGTEIGDSNPYDETLKEGEELMHVGDNQNSPEVGTNEVGNSEPYVNEETVKVEDAAGLDNEEEDEEDYEDYPFPDVAKDDYDYDNEDNDEENEYEIDLSDDDNLNKFKTSSKRFGKNGMKGLENWQNDWNKFDDNDDYYSFESKKRNGGKLSEAKLDLFGKHPAYQKSPMTTPPNKEVAKNARVWDDKSVESEEPFGEKIGSSAPYDELVDTITESIMSVLYGKKKM